MSDFYLAQVPVSGDPALRPVWDAIHRIDAENCIEVVSNDDLADAAETRAKRYTLQDDYRTIVLVALRGEAPADGERSEHGLPFVGRVPQPDVLGFAEIDLPVKDNLELAFSGVVVGAAHRAAGIGTALADAGDAVARAAGRTKVTTWTGHRHEAEPAAPNALAAPTGAGVLDRDDPVVRFAEAHGFSLEQTERHSVLQLPVSADVLADLRAQAAEKADGYRVLTWAGPTPPEHLDAMAALHRRMSVDVPMGGLEFEEENWDAERVERTDKRAIALGRTVLTVAAQHLVSGELVAFTVLVVPQERPAVAFQNDTLVHGEHRGHRLGLLVKLANLDLLAAERPAVDRIHTWNAGENQWMLAINVAMGFRRASTEGAWQKHY